MNLAGGPLAKPDSLGALEPPAGALGEEAKLRRRGVLRQPAVAEWEGGSVAKSNNFVTAAGRSPITKA